MDLPPIRFAAARRGRIAYQEWGDGEETVVAVPPLAQNIEVAWEQPTIAAMMRRFGTFARYLHFDKLGTGASDRSVPVAGLDERVDDLRDVIDAAELGPVHLFAQSEGAPMALLFAASYPRRVRSVTVFGGFARLTPDDLDDDERAAIAERQRGVCDRWGTDDSDIVDRFAPSLAVDPEFRRWHHRYERLAATSDSLFNLLQLSVDADVREALPRVEAPVLVLHRTGDQAIPIDAGRVIADGVPDGRFVELDGIDHFAYAGDVEAWMRVFKRFVTGSVGAAPLQVRAPGSPDARRVAVHTLGRFAVEVDGAPVPTSAWGSRRARTLLKRLVVADGWPVTRDELCDLLWPDETDRHKLGARLSVQLSAVRRVLDGGVIADRETVALDLSVVDTDLHRLTSTADTSTTAADTSTTAADTSILAAYTGEFLPEDGAEPWTEQTRALARRTAREAGHRLLAQAEGADAVALARRLLEIDRFDLAAHEALVDILTDEGDTAGATRAVDAYRRAADELGVPAQR